MNKDWLDIGVLEDYLQGKLDAKTMNRVEREALEDPFVAEALAGLSESPKQVMQSLSLLQKQLHERVNRHQTAKKTSVITWQRLSIAAAAAVMFIAVSIMFWMRENNHQQELAGRAKKIDVNLAPPVVKESPVAAKPAEPAGPERSGDRADKVKEIDRAIAAAKTNTYAARAKMKSAEVQPEAAARQLDEVAIVGYNVQRKSALSAGVSVVASSKPGHVLSGKVVAQDDGTPLPGVSVRMTGTDLTAVTDANGEFKINADTSVKAGMIRADYIGYKHAETLAKANQPVSIALRPENMQLNEVVTVGYGKARKKEQTADSNKINAALEGKVAGIRIRGMNSVAKAPAALVSNPVGGWDKLFQYIKQNNAFANTPKTGQSVELSFRISKDGSPADIKIVKGAEIRYEEEAIRLILNGPKWERPAKSRSRMTFMIDF